MKVTTAILVNSTRGISAKLVDETTGESTWLSEGVRTGNRILFAGAHSINLTSCEPKEAANGQRMVMKGTIDGQPFNGFTTKEPHVLSLAPSNGLGAGDPVAFEF